MFLPILRFNILLQREVFLTLTDMSKTRGKVGVSFQVENDSDHSPISVVQSSKSQIDVHVGFLKVLNRYAIQFTLPNVLQLSENVTCSAPGLGIEVKKILYQESGIVMFIEYLPEHKEGVIKEKLYLESDPNCRLTIVLNMEILGKNQGTPSLKLGVKCIERCSDYDSEASDWQGFD